MTHTHDKPGNPRWLEVSLELDHRAKIYNLKDKKPASEVRKQERNIQGIIPCQYYPDRFKHENLTSSSWDWVFGPLIQLIFDLDLATWICLGHFEGGYSRWLYYFSHELSPRLDSQKLDSKKMQVEEMRAFLRAYRCFSYNAWRKFTKPPILLTSTLMQKIMSANIDNEEFPQGASLFLSFASDSPKSMKIPFDIPYLWNIDLIEEAQRAQIERRAREKILAEVCPNEYITRVVSNFLSSEGSSELQDKIISFRCNENDSGSIPTDISPAAGKYEKALRNIFNDRTTLTQNKFSEKLWKYYKEYRKTDVIADAQFARFVVWLNDSVEALNGVLSIPAWFPPGSGSRESASLIVGFKRPVSIDELKAIISAFRLGSSSISIRSERKEGEEKGAKLSAIISGHEAGAQLVAMRDLMSYITDERLEKTVRKLIYGSINYIHLYLADNPNTAKIKKFYIAKDESIKSWVKKIAEFSWQIALARGIGDVEPDTKLLLRIEELLENHMPGIDLNIPDNLFFNPSRCIEENYSTFRPTLARWFLAGLSNSIKWSGQIKEGKNLNYWLDKKSSAFKSIRVEISQEDDQTVKIAILNKYHYPYTDLKKDNKIVGTKRVLQVINTDLPVKGGKLTFDFNKSNIEEFETSIILEGEIFKCVISKENQEE